MAISFFIIGTLVLIFGIKQIQNSVIQTVIIFIRAAVLICQEQFITRISPNKFIFSETCIRSTVFDTTGFIGI